jgi:enoyl-CoA hydratase/carnithine racemase
MDEPGASVEPDIWVNTQNYITTVTLANPAKRNALTLAMWQRLGEVFETLRNDAATRVVILSGAGDRAFCSGNDISEFPHVRSSAAEAAIYEAVTSATYRSIRTHPKPIIARIDGVCVGGGFELAQLGDMQFASTTSRFAMTPAKLGLGYKFEDIALLADKVGPRNARDMLLTGRMIEAAEAFEMGIITALSEPTTLDSKVADLAQSIAANAPLTIEAIKFCLAEFEKPEHARDLETCAALAAKCHDSEDYQEGQRAFAEKRAPAFRAR